ncbi:MAG TPA: glycosyltransferase [Bryobacteraceae bacterium]
MTDKFEIIVIGYRWFWQTLERTIDSILRTNKHNLRVNVGLNSPEPEMLAMLEKYRRRLNIVEVSNLNLNKVGMQRRLVHLCTAKYIISFDDDSFVIHKDWQDFLIQRIESYENKTLRYFGDFGEEKEAKFRQMTGNTVGILGLICYAWLDEPKRKILAKCPWYDPVNKLNHNGFNRQYNKEQIWYVAGGFYAFLREPYLKFDYPGFDYRMAYEDTILSFFYQHHGYRIGDFGEGFDDSGLDNKGGYAAFGNRLIVNAGQRTYDIESVESKEHSLDVRACEQFYGNEYL